MTFAMGGVPPAGSPQNVNNLRYADDTDHVAEREEELKSLLMKVKEESYAIHTAVPPPPPSYPGQTQGLQGSLSTVGNSPEIP